LHYLLDFSIEIEKERDMQYQESFKPERGNSPGIFPSDNAIFIDSDRGSPPPTPQVHQNDLPLTKREATRRQILAKIFNQDIPEKDLLAQYIRRAFQKNIKLSSIKSSCGCNVQFLSYLRDSGSTAGLGDLHRSHIEGFVERQQDRGLNPSTINTQLACIYAFIRFLVNQGRASAELFVRKVAIQVPTPLPKDIPRDDEDVLLSVIDDTRDRAMILLLLRTGMRIGELLATRMSDINLQMQAITITESEKTGSGRVVYFSNDAAEALYDWLMIRDCSQDHLFYGRGRKPLSYAAARVMFLKYIDKAGLSHKGYTLHCLRHTLATSLLNALVSIEVVQVILGHINLMQTQRYAKLYDKTSKEEYFRAMAIIEGERE
jgi:integrase/recombinase XerD